MSDEEFEKQTLDNLITDLKDIDKYTSFKNGAFIYDLGKYQGTLLINHIEQLKEENKQLEDLLHKANDEMISYTNCCIDLKEKIDKAVNDLQELIVQVNNKTIIGLNEFIPKLEVIQDELVGDKENE